jgi:hypothetical protein
MISNSKNERAERIRKLIEVVPYPDDKTREGAIQSFSKSSLTLKQIHDIVVKPTLELLNFESERRPILNKERQLGGVY